MNLSNCLTISRIIITPLICALILSGNYIFALYSFIFASVTDFLDGFIARKVNKVTNSGKILDPISDKILTFSVLSCFVKMRILNIWAFIILLSRDFIISSIRIILAKNDVIYEANILGKLKTLFQFLFIFTLLLSNGNKMSFIICSEIFIWISVVLSIISLTSCIIDNKSILFKEFR